VHATERNATRECKRTFNAVSHFGAKQSTRCGGPSLTKDRQTEQASVLEWYDRHRA